MSVTEARADLSPVAPPPRPRGRWRSIGVLVVVALAILALLSQGLLSSLNYFETVDQVLAHRAAVGTKEIRLEGLVAARTIVRTAVGTDFVVTGSKGRVVVHATGEPPQLFAADIPVVVVGHFTTRRGLTFAATSILVKHTATYIAQHPTRVRAPNGSTR